MKLTEEQEKFIEDNMDKMKHKDIAVIAGISKWKLSLFINKKRHFKKRDSQFFQVELPLDHTWII